MKIGKRKSLERIGRAAIREMARAIFVHGVKRNKESDALLSDDKNSRTEVLGEDLSETVGQENAEKDKIGNVSGSARIRPTENGLLTQRQSRPRRVSDMTKKERAEIAARAAEGAFIKFN